MFDINSINACAALVERGDPNRFMAAMSAPPAARARLFALYAFNLEVARAPWVTQEPMIAEMRLQFWRDVVEEAAMGGAARAHEVAAPLATVIRECALPLATLDGLITARRWDIYQDAFGDQAALECYISDTSGALMWLAARALGADMAFESQVREIGYGAGVAQWLSAVSALESRGRIPLVDGRPEAVLAWAQSTLARLSAVPSDGLRGAFAPALRAGWQTRTLLKQVIRDPGRVADGTLGTSEFRKKSSLIHRTMTGSW